MTICSNSDFHNLQQHWCIQPLMHSTALPQVVLSGILRLVIQRVDASWFNNLQQVCEWQLAATLIFTTCNNIDAFNRLAASCSIRLFRLVIHRLDASCFFNLQQVCKYQVTASLMFTDLIESTGCLIQLVGKLHLADKIRNLHQVCGVFGCVEKCFFLAKKLARKF